jgi:hypothetical protein
MAFDVIVADDGLWLAARDPQPIEFAGDPGAGDRRIGDQCQTLAGAVVDDVRVSEIPGQDFGKSRTGISVIPGQRFR